MRVFSMVFAILVVLGSSELSASQVNCNRNAECFPEQGSTVLLGDQITSALQSVNDRLVEVDNSVVSVADSLSVHRTDVSAEHEEILAAASRPAAETSSANSNTASPVRPVSLSTAPPSIWQNSGALSMAASSAIEDHWAKLEECMSASDTSLFYYPNRVQQKELGPNQVRRGISRSGCALMDVPDRMTQGFPRPGWAWVRLEAGREGVFDTRNGELVALHECWNSIEDFVPLPLLGGPAGPRGDRGPAGPQGLQGEVGKSADVNDGGFSWKPWLIGGAIALGTAAIGTSMYVCITDWCKSDPPSPPPPTYQVGNNNNNNNNNNSLAPANTGSAYVVPTPGGGWKIGFSKVF